MREIAADVLQVSDARAIAQKRCKEVESVEEWRVTSSRSSIST